MILKKFFSGFTSGGKKKKNIDADSVKIYIEETSYKTLKKDKDINCRQICQKFMHVFPRKSKKSQFRIIMTLKSNKKGEKIISKRILNDFEKIFDGSFLEKLKKMHRQYTIVDVQEYLLRQHYLPVQMQSIDKPLMDLRVEREGLLEMTTMEKKKLEKKQFILTPDVLIYHSPKSKDKLYQILLLYIEQIYVKDKAKGKIEKLCFYLSTSNKTYQIKCKSNLDRNVWIKSLIHYTNLAKENSKIIDINRRISQIKTHQFEIDTRNSIFDKSIVLDNREKMDKSFQLLLKKHDKFFNHPNSEAISQFLKNMGHLINELYELKQKAGDTTKISNMKEEAKGTETMSTGEQNDDPLSLIRKNITQIEEIISEGKESLENLNTLGWNKLSLNNMTNCEGNLDDKITAVLRFADDLFYFLQRLSVSHSVFLEEYYKEAEYERLKKLKKFII